MAGGHLLPNTMHTSKIRRELRMKYLLKKVSPWVLYLALALTLWLSQLIVATASLPVSVTIYHVK